MAKIYKENPHLHNTGVAEPRAHVPSHLEQVLVGLGGRCPMEKQQRGEPILEPRYFLGHQTPCEFKCLLTETQGRM